MTDYYKITEVTENIYRITSGEAVFMDLFAGTEKALLYDTGFGFGDLHAAVRSITDLPVTIVNSHGHVDHTCGNYQFPESDVYLHENDMEVMAAHNTESRRRLAAENARFTLDYVTGKTSDILPEDFNEEVYVHAEFRQPAPLDEGHVFDLGKMQLETVHFRGHTKGAIGLLNKQTKTMYMGDAMNPFVWLFMPESDPISMYIDALNKAKAIGFDTFFIGHDPRPMPKANLDHYLDAAENIDFENGFPFESPIVQPGDEVRVCPRSGYSPDDFFKEGFAAVVISKDNIR